MADDLIPDDLAGAGIPVPAVPMAAVVHQFRHLAGRARAGLTGDDIALVLEAAADGLERELRKALLHPETPDPRNPEENP